jgi:PAS domain S-box-containing protein
MGVSRDVTDRKRAEDALLKSRRELEQRVAELGLNEARLEAVLQLSHMAETPLKQITDFVLERAVTLTRSKIGYLAFMNEDETVLTMHSWSKEAMAECAIADKPLVYPLATTGLWGEAARQRKPMITNDYAAPNPWKKGIPAGHVQLHRHMNVPILDGGRIVIVAGVGNKEDDYDESDVRQLTLLMQGMWILIRRQRAQADLEQYRARLEHLVRDRTKDLQQSRDELQAIYDQIVDGIVIADLDELKAVRMNAAFCRMLGYSEAELRMVSPEQLYPGEFGREVVKMGPQVCEFVGAIRKGQVVRANNVPVRRKDGSVVYADIVSRGIRYDERSCVISFFHDVTERNKAEEALRKEHRTLRHLLQSSDHERQLIAYEIHDELAQQLAGAIMQLQAYTHQKDKNPEQAAKMFDGGMAMLQQGHAEARRLINGVRPPILDEEGVVPAITHLLNDERHQKGPRIEFRARIDFDRLAPILENAIYRIVQEGLTNACQHSKSKTVRISLVQREDRLRIEIRDWGIGFDMKTAQENRFGLVGIRQRARLLGDKCSIRGKVGEGTRIAVELPVVSRE